MGLPATAKRLVLVDVCPAPNDLEEGCDIGHDSISLECEALQGALGRLRIARAARIGDDDRNLAEVHGMSNRRFNPDFQRDAGDRHRGNAAVAQGNIQRRALERGHRDLVEDGFAR